MSESKTTIDVIVPSLGESVTEVTIGQILAPEGSFVVEDAELLEMETDKVNQLIYAPASGNVHYCIKEGDTLLVGEKLASIDVSSGNTLAACEGSTQSISVSPGGEERSQNMDLGVDPAQGQINSVVVDERSDTLSASSIDAQSAMSFNGASSLGHEMTSGVRVSLSDFVANFSVDHTRRMHNMPPSALQQEQTKSRAGASSNGKGLISNAGGFHADGQGVKSEGVSCAKVISDDPLSERVSRRPMPKIRQVIAQRLHYAKLSTAMLTTFNEVDMTRVMELRSKYKESFLQKHGVKLGFMSFFVKAVVSALKEQPGLNSTIEGDEIVTRHYYDISIAVGSDKGLVVPVVKSCDEKSFAAIESDINDFAQRSRKGTLRADEMQGGCFTITNGGVYGSLLSTPILNPPQSGILGMHKIQKRAVVIDDQVCVRPMMYLALSYDHRIVDGKEAVTFLMSIKNSLENPSTLLFEL